jgi:hypothetical protein
MGTLLAAGAVTLVFCAPGYPGETGDAQPYLDQFAKAAAAAAGWPVGSLTAVYDPTEEGGLAKLSSPDAALTFVPYPFFVEHAAQLHLAPLVQADAVDTGPRERWTLVAKRGRVTGPRSLSGYTLLGTAGYARDFVRHAALPAWPLPADIRIEATGQVLSALRRVAAGEAVAVLLDQPEAAALASLPFASDLQTLVRSPELPVALLAVVDSRLPAPRARTLRSGLLKMSHEQANAEILASLRLRGFLPPELPGRAATP